MCKVCNNNACTHCKPAVISRIYGVTGGQGGTASGVFVWFKKVSEAYTFDLSKYAVGKVPSVRFYAIDETTKTLSPITVDYTITYLGNTLPSITSAQINIPMLPAVYCVMQVIGISGEDVMITDGNGSTDPEVPDPTPTIYNFSLNISNVVGSQTITPTAASFNVTHSLLIKPNSLRVFQVSDNTTVISNAAVSSPAAISGYSLNVIQGNSYSWRASIEDLDGNVYQSNVFTIQATVPSEPAKQKTMYYGNTDVAPATFNTLGISAIFGLEGITSKVITGTGNNQFIINQTSSLHYLLIPVDDMDLISSQYGTTLITNLWNGTEGAYFTTNPGGIFNGVTYRVFFSYSPIGAFAEDIRVTCKNK